MRLPTVRVSAARCNALAALTGVALLVAGCAPVHRASREAVLRIGMRSEPHSLSPLLMQHVEEMEVDRLFSDPLTSYDERGNLVPALAQSVPSRANGGISPDERTITYHLRRGVRWQDGAPFTSADVRFTFDQVMNPRNNVVSRAGYDDVDRVDTPAPDIVRFHLRTPFAPIVGTLFGDDSTPFGMLPRHLLAGRTQLNDAPYNALPIGTGPYRVSRWIRGDRLELVANSMYFRGRPAIDRVSIVFVADETTLVNRVRAHELDWAPEIGPSSASTLRAAPGVRTAVVPQNQWFGIFFQLQHASVASLAVRHAIAQALDRPQLASSLTLGTAEPAVGDLPAFLWASPRGLRGAAFDPGAARAEYAAARTTTEPLSLAYDATNDLARVTAVQVQASLAAAGIPIALHAYRREVFLGTAEAGGIMQSGRFDLALSRLLWGPDPDNSGSFTCAAIPPAGYNLERYCNPEMERLQHVALEHSERATRADAYAHIEQLIVRDLPVLPLWWPGGIHALSTRLHGFRANGLVSTWNSYEWSLTDAP